MIERLQQNFIPEHYDLFLHVEPFQNLVEGRVSINFKKNQDSDSLELHIGQNIDIKTITQNGQTLEYIINNSKLIIQKPANQELEFSEYPIIIDYTIEPSHYKKEGLYIHNGNYLTQLQPNYARQLFPCFDEPCIRSTFTVTIKIPTNLTGISNMPIEKVTKESNEQTITFLKTPSMCTYLLCICIGNFSCIKGFTSSDCPINFYGTSGEEMNLNELLQVAEFAIEWMEINFKVKYDLPHIQFLFYEGCPSGMENYGLITLLKTRERSFYWNSKVIMHEVIHLWFGDLVEIKWWNSIWLNEGFAQFIQYLILSDYFPDINAFEFFTYIDAFRCFNYFHDERKLAPLESDVNLSTVCESMVYVKGAFVLKMFYDLIGRDSFFNVCSHYLISFKNKNVEVSDFINSVNSVLNDDFSPFFNPWLKYPQFPVIVVNEISENVDFGEKKKIGVTISQISDSNVYFNFKVPVVYEFNGEIKKIDVNIKDFITELNFEYDWIIVNDGFASLCFVMYSKVLLSSLINAKRQGKLSNVNCLLIYQSIRLRSVPYLIDEEVFRISNDIYRGVHNYTIP